ncbi:MAG TPA: O-antigen ligase family protein [Humisphaera sp.]
MQPLALTTSDRRIPGPERLFLLAAVLVSGTVTLPQAIDAGFLSGLGLWTICCAGLSWGLWAMRPRAPLRLAPALLPLAAFTAYAALSPIWGVRFESVWIQQLAVLVAFGGCFILAGREASLHPRFGEALLRALDLASVTAAVGYTLTYLAFGGGADAVIGGKSVFVARGFALFALLAVARQLARYHAGDLGGIVIAVWLTALVTLSQSRLGMVACAALFPVSHAIVGGRRNWAAAVVMTAAAAGGLALMLTLSQEMHDRFFGYDASLEVGGVAVNASGRTAAWEALIGDIRTPAKLCFGWGVGAASTYVSLRFENLPHPHNEYIRFLYDFGLFGLGSFVVFLATALVMSWRRTRAATAAIRGTGQARATLGLPLTALLSAVGIAVSFLTDNAGIYVFVMAPLGMVLGAALAQPMPPRPGPKHVGRGSRLGDEKPPVVDYGDGLDWVFTELPAQLPPPGPPRSSTKFRLPGPAPSSPP